MASVNYYAFWELFESQYLSLNIMILCLFFAIGKIREISARKNMRIFLFSSSEMAQLMENYEAFHTQLTEKDI